MGYLQSAIRFCEREHGTVWRRVFGEGRIQCLGCVEKIALAKGQRKRVNRISKRTMRVLDSVMPASLSNDEKREFLSLSAMHGALTVLSADKTDKKLKSDTPVKADPNKLLAAMMEGAGEDRAD